MAGNLKSPPGVCKVVTLVLGVIILGVGLHSHFESAWTKLGTSTSIRYKVHKICDVRRGFPDGWPYAGFKAKSCPSISMEHYFVSIIIICFILSAAVFSTGFFIDLESHPLKWIDVAYHGVSAALLLIAGIVYLVSNAQIKGLLTDQTLNLLGMVGVNFRGPEKVAAGSLTILQSLLYALIALLVAKN